ncbi:hypothetical protein [uncultured Pseudoteredinibacter sp.]|uniref:hypothetical protein n=1 Tax=uncultured Pseudoteredinibacter sp. TaxID=1641701 RepID=UPI002616CC84|nr:hypothetical protein [uncultured Pseudoteredinibacter sp.]
MKQEHYIATVGGAFLLVLVDLMCNLNAATTLKLGTVLELYIFSNISIGKGLLGLLLVLISSAFLCWVKQPKDRAASLTLGLSIFAVLNAVTPYSIVSDGKTEGEQKKEVNKGLANHISIPLVSQALAQDKSSTLQCRAGSIAADSYLNSEKNVSSCKPYFSGLFGLGSFFSNTIEYCYSGVYLPKNQKVKYMSSWETSIRSYRYTKIEFDYEGKVCEGWVSDGRKDTHHVIKNS